MTDDHWLVAPQAVPIRRMTEGGIDRFREFLREAQAGGAQALPTELIGQDEYARIIEFGVTVESSVFVTALDMARYLHPRIESLTLKGKYYDPGLWAWLTAFYFDSVCPADTSGRRKVGEIARYIPPANRNFYESNRHLLALPVRMYDMHSEDSLKLLLYAPPSEQTLTMNLVSQSQELSTNPGILDALRVLYWDEHAQRPKRGFGATDKPGTLRRFVAVMNQFNRTFDLFAMTGEQIIELLPKEEFARWLK